MHAVVAQHATDLGEILSASSYSPRASSMLPCSASRLPFCALAPALLQIHMRLFRATSFAGECVHSRCSARPGIKRKWRPSIRRKWRGVEREGGAVYEGLRVVATLRISAAPARSPLPWYNLPSLHRASTWHFVGVSAQILTSLLDSLTSSEGMPR
jgi:hypothetical protein